MVATPVPDDLAERARAWIAGDPDPDTRAGLRALLDAGDVEALRERLDGVLAFGTAGLRGVVGAGPMRMNRAVVIRTSWGVATHVLDTWGTTRPVVVGFDARADSERFARDVVGVLAAAALPVRWFHQPVPTPLVAYAARVLHAAAAVVVTASHNPPEYNGYKVYGDNAAQIAPPVDADIAARIAAAPAAVDVPRLVDVGDDDLVATVAGDMSDRYLADIAVARRRSRGTAGLEVVYTPLHGVGGRLACQALGDAGHTVHVVTEQFAPDAAFPTVPFPNPEEPGALELAAQLADDVSADLVLANDPDADRLAVAVPVGAAGGGRRRGRPGPAPWRTLSGNEVGVLLGAYALDRAAVDRPLTVSTVVSSPMLADVAAAHGARHEVTLTGFKWICAAALDLARHEGLDFVYGYEEALGYAVGTAVRDKDGIGAAVAFADLAAALAAQGRTVEDRLDELYRTYGLWVSHQKSIVRQGLEGQADIAAAMERLGHGSGRGVPAALGGRAVTAVSDYREGEAGRPRWLPDTPLVAFAFDDGRALIRPSGTEPKLKIYVDLRADVAHAPDLDARRSALAADAVKVADDVAAFVRLT